MRDLVPYNLLVIQSWSNMIDLEAFSVDDAWSGLVILLLGNPHLLEGRKGGEDGATDPDRVFSLRRSDDFNLH